MRMRRTSSMVEGCPWQECSLLTMNSEAIPSGWALRYSTTPSFPVSISMSGSTAIIECPVTPGTKGSLARFCRFGLSAYMPSMLVGTGRKADGSFSWLVNRTTLSGLSVTMS